MKRSALWRMFSWAAAAAGIGLASGGVAHAGAGWGDSTNAAGGAIKVPTYYANTPSGVRVDPLGGPAIDTGTPLRKFVDGLPLATPAGANALTQAYGRGQYIPVAVSDITTYPGSDYYEIAVVEYAEKLHSDLPKATTLRGYVQLETAANAAASRHVALTYPDGTPILDSAGKQIYAVDDPHYMGPIINATKDVPVRVKYSNLLPRGHFDAATGQRNGDLFLPVDETLMSAGLGPDGVNKYTQNRAVIHLHGGVTPWISDGTPHQWTAPAGENTPYKTGASFQNVPDMPDPGEGSGTLFYTNQQSGRFMFYHDHTAGLTRLNVYGGEAAAYVISDPVESALPLPADQIPLVVQEKTFVPKDVAIQDAKWDTAHWGQYGDLWYPHVYEPNQDPNSFDGTNPPGRWDYGPWFWPVFPATQPLPTGAYGDVTTTPEAFGDTPLVNGTAYPVLNVDPKAYRFRILNASNDRMFNLGFYVASKAVASCTVTAGGAGYHPGTTTVSFSGGTDTAIPNAQAPGATVTVDATGAVTGLTLTSFGSGYVAPPTVTFADTTLPGGSGAAATCTLSDATEVASVPFDSTGTFPSSGGLLGTGWGQPDSRIGGVPSPATIGPPIIQIGNEGGLLPAPVVIPSTPVNYEYNKRSVTVLNVLEHGLYLGPAERADVVVDFSRFAGKTLILYNDSPAPVPAGDPRLDYYTGDPDQTAVGGAPTTLPGYGPNTRTIMQVRVASTLAGGAAPVAYDPAPLTAALAAAYAATQPKPVVAETAYNAPFATAYGNVYARIFTGSATQQTFNFIAGDTITYYPLGSATPVTVAEGQAAQIPVQNKAIQELFDPHGRMNATLGVEIPFTSALTQTTIPLGYIDPATETIADGETQIWKITHNGVDTHPVHFHLVNVQVINRVGWDGTVKPPNDNEVGWKETVKMNPLEDIIVAVRAKAPTLPGFGIPASVRLYDPSQPADANMGFTQVDPATGNPATVTNKTADFGWEYVWHCHILGHEENDFMRPFIFRYTETLPAAPTNLAVTNGVSLTWSDNSGNEIGFRIERAEVTGGIPGTFTAVGKGIANTTGYTDAIVTPGVTYAYRVIAYNAAGDSAPSNVASITPVVGAPGAPVIVTAVPGNAQASVAFGIPATDGGSPIVSYTVTSSPGGFTASGSGSPITVTGLTNGASYTFTVTATNAIGTGPASAPSTAVTPFGVPSAPVIGTATPGNAQATVTFAPPLSNGGSAVTSYTVTSSPGGFTATGTASPIAVTGLANGTAYTFAVTATNAAGTGPASAASNSVTPATLPGAPIIGTATPGTGSATVAFSAPASNGGSAVTSYTVTSSPGGFTASGSASPITMTGLANGTAYTFSVTATNAIGTGPASAASNSVVPAAAPGAPAITGVVGGNAQVTVTFTSPASNGGAAITTYTVTSNPGGITASGAASPVTVTGLANGTAYTFTVTAGNWAGSGPASAPSAAVVPATVPGPPVIGAAIPGVGQATVNFTAPADNGGSVITSYTVTSNPGGITATAASGPITVTGLANGTTYTFTVTATNAVGTGAPSAASNGVTPSATPPAAPTALTATPSATTANGPTVTLAWTSGSGTAAGFIIQRATNSGFTAGLTTFQVTAPATTYTDTTVTARVRYYYRVFAYNMAGNSGYSNAVNTITHQLPATPSSLTVTATTRNSVTIDWTDNASNESGFYVMRGRTSAGPWSRVATLPANAAGPPAAVTFTNNKLTSNRTYWYRVQAYNADGTSPLTAAASATTLP